jgi:effector-binding domain-containing protein
MFFYYNEIIKAFKYGGHVMRKVIIVALVVIFISAVGFVFFITSGPDLKKYEYLKQPRITTMESQKMIEVRLKGDPNVTAMKGIGRLFSIYYQLKNNHLKMAAPRARWPVSFDTKKENWVGIYGLPVSSSVNELPKQKKGIIVKLVTWSYGTVAEILHRGPYTTETATIEKIKQFIKANGYEIVGDHEEEYLKGPGLWPSNPKNYYTIIRYRIQKKSE